MGIKNMFFCGSKKETSRNTEPEAKSFLCFPNSNEKAMSTNFQGKLDRLILNNYNLFIHPTLEEAIKQGAQVRNRNVMIYYLGYKESNARTLMEQHGIFGKLVIKGQSLYEASMESSNFISNENYDPDLLSLVQAREDAQP